MTFLVSNEPNDNPSSKDFDANLPTSIDPKTLKRHSYPIKFKLEAVEYAIKNNNLFAANQFQINRRQIIKWCKIKKN